MAKQNDLGPEWVRKATAAAAAGVKERAFDARHRKNLPPEALREVGGLVWVHLPSLVQFLVAEATAEAAQAQGSGDPMLAGGNNSPALEEYRTHRARLAKMEADEREGLIIRFDVIRPAIMGGLAVVRRAWEALERRFGPEAAAILAEAVDDAEQTIAQVVDDAHRDAHRDKPDAGAGQRDAAPADGVAGGPGTPPADDAGVCRAGDRDPERPV